MYTINYYNDHNQNQSLFIENLFEDN